MGDKLSDKCKIMRQKQDWRQWETSAKSCGLQETEHPQASGEKCKVMQPEHPQGTGDSGRQVVNKCKIMHKGSETSGRQM